MLKTVRKIVKPSPFLRKFNRTYQILLEKYLRYADLLKLQYLAIEDEDLEKIERYKSLEELYSNEIMACEKTFSAVCKDIKKAGLAGDEEPGYEKLDCFRKKVLSLSESNQVLLEKKLFKIESILRNQIKNKYAIRNFSTENSPEIVDIEA